ncbi:MAG: VTT domain-containing protein [Planctomycetaceae bacterium]|nr:VTT domain-containing protein [Planctomycetales bacterium]MCB9922502.1 VTT domain-containing protein [Planctomycetaceae bacterium]
MVEHLNYNDFMKPFIRPMIVMSLILLVPIVPFLLFGANFEAWVVQWSKHPYSQPATALVIIGLLATDILLPTPSSMISTLGGWQLGIVGGTLASWIGMSLGAIIGFLLARRWGRPLALWLSSEEDLDRMHGLSQRFGPVVLVFGRGVPVLAEASVLLMGIHQLSWRRFLPAVLLSNLGIAFAYSAFGNYAEQNQWLPLALGVSIALPVLLATMVGRFLPSTRTTLSHETDTTARDEQ